jgi:hypothetical protein
MASKGAGDSRRAVKDILDAAQSLRKTLSKVRDRHPDFPKIGVQVTETEESACPGAPSVSARMVVTISAVTAERAFELAKPFEDRLGCICTSSGETEVTCDCPDVK